MNLKSIIQQFQILGNIEEIIPWGNGHINDSFRVKIHEHDKPDYLLQRINHLVFKNVEGLMQNITQVTYHIQKKSKFRDLVLDIIPTKKEESYLKDDSGYWRLFEFIDDKKSYETSVSVELSHQAGRTFGEFAAAVSDFPIRELHNTIPEFHNINHRIDQFKKALASGNAQRREKASEQIKEVQSLSSDFCALYNTAVSGEIPLRVTHNDTKFNNVLLGDEGDTGIVIDLDTIMPGYVFFDIGDGLRSGAISAEEDEPNLTKIYLNADYYKAYLDGFLTSAGALLTKKEKAMLPKSGSYMAFIMAVRFLTDFLNGDTYYKTKYMEHNLVRAKNQLKVCDLLFLQSRKIP